MTRPRHPEAIGDEVMIGNMFTCDFPLVGWSTKRKATCYNLAGERLRPAGFVSILVSRAEIEAVGVVVPDSGTVDHRW